MTVYSLYIYDRQCSCVFYHAFTGHAAPTRAGTSTLPNVFPPTASTSNSSTTTTAAPPVRPSSVDGRPHSLPPPWERSGSAPPPVSANGVEDERLNEQTTNGPTNDENRAPSGPVGALPFDEEAKLVYGIVFSLRNLVKKLTPSGRDSSDSFHSYSTSKYKLHYLHTPTNYHFVLVSSPRTDSLRPQLRALYAGAFLEWVVRNPMVEIDSTQGTGIDNVAFRTAVERVVGSV